MNCGEFRNSMIEVVRGGAAPALESAALEHAGTCETCNRLLTREGELRAAFQSIASGNRSAGPQVESALLEAFDAHFQAAGKPVLVSMPTSIRPRHWALWAVAAAALLAVAAFVARPRQQPTPIAVTPTPQVQPVPAPREIPALEKIEAAAARPVRKPSRRRAVPSPAETEVASSQNEFVALPYGNAMGPPERAQVLRVTMPRSALSGLGLPVNLERAQDMIRADIVVGDDSIARAIRFVDRNTNQNRIRRANYER